MKNTKENVIIIEGNNGENMLTTIVLIITYTIIAFIFGCLCYDNFIGITDLAWILGLFWGIVLPFMIIYALLNTVIKWVKMCWR